MHSAQGPSADTCVPCRCDPSGRLVLGAQSARRDARSFDVALAGLDVGVSPRVAVGQVDASAAEVIRSERESGDVGGFARGQQSLGDQEPADGFFGSRRAFHDSILLFIERLLDRFAIWADGTDHLPKLAAESRRGKAVFAEAAARLSL
jgi:hypothetical protein